MLNFTCYKTDKIKRYHSTQENGKNKSSTVSGQYVGKHTISYTLTRSASQQNIFVLLNKVKKCTYPFSQQICERCFSQVTHNDDELTLLNAHQVPGTVQFLRMFKCIECYATETHTDSAITWVPIHRTGSSTWLLWIRRCVLLLLLFLNCVPFCTACFCLCSFIFCYYEKLCIWF